MKRFVGNMWDIALNYQLVCVTTNGFVKNNGEAVMGRGCAFEAKTRYPDLPLLLGQGIKQNGNVVQSLKIIGDNCVLAAFPVKHNWWEEADIELIKTSCNQLMQILHDYNISSVLLPMPGVGNGKLNFQLVEQTIEKILDDRVTVITKEERNE